jgi:hypothetical protein
MNVPIMKIFDSATDPRAWSRLRPEDKVCHTPQPTPQVDDEDDDEDDDNDRGSGGGDIDPDEDEGWSEEDDEDEDDTLWAAPGPRTAAGGPG